MELAVVNGTVVHCVCLGDAECGVGCGLSHDISMTWSRAKAVKISCYVTRLDKRPEISTESSRYISGDMVFKRTLRG